MSDNLIKNPADTTAERINVLLKRIQELESEKRFDQDLLNLLPLPIFYEDQNGKYLSCNQAFCDFMGKPKDEIISKTVFEINASPAAQNYFEHDLLMMARNMSCEVVERVMLRGDGEYRNVSIYKSLLTRLGSISGIVGVLLDVTDLKKAQSQEEFYREKLVALTSALSAAKEQERRLIAREIHDSISQTLALAKLQLKLLGTRISSEELSRELSAVIGTLDQALSYTRNLTFELGIPVLYQLGLNSALEWLCDELRKKYNFNVHYQPYFLPRIKNDNFETFLFRSAQELLMNAVKHSGVKEASLTIFKSEQDIFISVHDEGKGFDAYRLSSSDFSKKTYGLFNLETQVRSLGGKVEIHSEPGKGTEIILKIPCDFESFTHSDSEKNNSV